MTGFASVSSAGPKPADDGLSSGASAPSITLDIRSVNSRFLDVLFRMPDELRASEPALRSAIAAKLKRGKVEVRVTMDSSAGASLPAVSPAALQQLSRMEDLVHAWLPGAASLSVAEAMRLAAAPVVGSALKQVLEKAARSAITALLDARKREGARLATMLNERIAQLRELAQKAEPLIPSLVDQQRQRFLERWQQALATAGDTQTSVTAESANDRALSEAAAFALRIDVAEELTRLQAHLDEIERLIGNGGEVGKRLDFLIQELHREANTLGSKSAALEVTRISVDMKVLIEQMREQVQNIE